MGIMDDNLLMQASYGILEILQKSSLSSARLNRLLSLLPALISTEVAELQVSWARVYDITVSKCDILKCVNECMKEIFTMSAFSNPTYQRKGAAMMLASLGNALGAGITEEVIRKAITLAQDISYEVRRTMCADLWKILQHVNNEIISDEIWEDLVELWADDAWEVKCEAVGVISFVISKLQSSFLVQKFESIWDDMRNSTHCEVAKTVLKHFGRVILVMKPLISQEKAKENLEYFVSLAKSTQEEVRYQVAYQLPAIVSIYGSFAGCVALFELLASDSSPKVKSTFEAGLAEILRMLKDLSFFPKLFNSIFQDPMLRIKAISHLKSYVPFLQSSETSVLPSISNLFKSALPWRDKFLILSSLLDTFDRLNIKQLKDLFFENLVFCIENEIYPVKQKAVELYAKILYETYQCSKKQEMISKMINSFYMSRKFQNRIIYIDLVIILRKLASRQFIKSYFLTAALNLAEDAVVDVRLKFVQNFVNLRECVERTDNRLASLFTTSLNNLMDDSSELIGRLAAKVQKEMLSSMLWNRMYSCANENEEQERQKYELLQQERERVDQEESSRKLIQELSTKFKQDTPIPRTQIKSKQRYLISNPRLNSNRRNSFYERARSSERSESINKSSTSVKRLRNK